MNDDDPHVGIVCSTCKLRIGVIKVKGNGILCARCWMNRHDELENPDEDEEL